MLLLLSSVGHPQVEETFLDLLKINFYLIMLLNKYLPHASCLSSTVLGIWVTGVTQTDLGRASSRQEEDKIPITVFANKNG